MAEVAVQGLSLLGSPEMGQRITPPVPDAGLVLSIALVGLLEESIEADCRNLEMYGPTELEATRIVISRIGLPVAGSRRVFVAVYILYPAESRISAALSGSYVRADTSSL